MADRPDAVATAAKQEQQPARAALPWEDSEMHQQALLQEAVAVDAHGRTFAASGTNNFVRPSHNFLLPLGEISRNS
jgi:hypothetical protein